MLTSLRGKLILIFVILTVSVMIISSGYARYKQRQFALDRAREQAVVDLQLISSDFHSVFQWIIRDLLVLRDLPSLQQAINTGDSKLRQAALLTTQEEFLTLATQHQIFQQLRFLDNNSMEILRINTKDRRTWLTSIDHLQDKSNRYYFKAASGLKQGQIYISPMNLNVEKGNPEHPLVPVIRYATPVVDHDGNTKGVLVLNVFGNTFLNLLQEQQDKSRHGERFFLLNNDGYFLYHPDYTKTFGFMLGTDDTFFHHEPGLTTRLQTEDQGITIQKSSETSKQTLFAFQRIQLNSTVAPIHNDDTIQNGESPPYWIVLTEIDDADLLVDLDEYVQSFLPFTLILLVICVAVAVAVAWSCSRPVVSLARTANQIKSGNFSARAQVYTKDEMGKFGSQFNEMAEKLEQTISRLQLSETKYRQIFENSQDCIFVADTSCTIIDINRAGRHLLGVAADEALEQLSLNCCQTNGSGSDTKTLIQQDIHSRGYVKDYETTLHRPDGTVRDCIMTASARYDQQGLLVGYEGFLRDITLEKQRQEAKQSFHKQLQEEIVLAEERERRHIGQVLHEEMAQNLALVGMKLQETQQLTTHNTDPEKEEEISRQLMEIRQLITLMIGQIRTMIFDLFPTVLDDRGLVPAMLWYGDHFTKRTHIDVSVYGASGSLGLAESQRIYLFRSFKELLHNAWKHAETREIVATVQQKDNHVRLTVDDEGIGFDPDKIKTASNDLKGIGLISIRQWVSAMEGTMSIESQPGKGTRVTIDIPLTTPRADT